MSSLSACSLLHEAGHHHGDGDMSDELWKLSACETVDLLRRKGISPLELIDVAARRIEAVEPRVNALPILCLERAREHARRLMQESSCAPAPNYLFGLPIVVKDLTAVAGVLWTEGSKAFAHRVADVSDILVQKLEANGAAVIAKSNTPEFGAGGNTTNDVFGVTRNPWNTACTSGGSSGGSAVAVATGEAWLATGTDMAGSVRIPSAFCSTVGLRPTPGRVAHGPRDPLFSPLNVDGPIARTVCDAAMMLDAMAGEHPGDPMSLPAPSAPFLAAARRATAPRRVAWSADLDLAPVHSEVRAICEKAVRSFEALGGAVEEDCPDLSAAKSAFYGLRNLERATALAQLIKDRKTELTPTVVHYTTRGMALTAGEIADAEAARGMIYRNTLRFFERYDLLVTPTVIAPPFPADMLHLMEVEGHTFQDFFEYLALTYAITLTTCPAISVPCGFTAAGLPVGLQLVGPPRSEAMLLSAAAAFEQHNNLHPRLPIDPRA
jgi:amidase